MNDNFNENITRTNKTILCLLNDNILTLQIRFL